MMVESLIKLALACSLNSKHKFYNFGIELSTFLLDFISISQVKRDQN